VRHARPLTGDDGSTLPLVIFFGLLSLLVILGVVAATSLYLERKRLFTLADGAALVGAEAFDLAQVSVGASGPRPTLNTEGVASAVRSYLATVPTAEFDGLTLERAEALDGLSATVTLSAEWRPPVLEQLLPSGVRIDVTAVARSVFG